MIEYGKVISIKNNIAEIQLAPENNCETCAKCTFINTEKHTVLARNTTNANIGDNVKVNIFESRTYAALILYMLPLFFFFVFYLLGNQYFKWNELISALTGIIGLSLVYVIIAALNKRPKVRNYIIKE